MVERSTRPTGRRIAGALLAGLFTLAEGGLCLAQTAALVPNASQQYFNSNGAPLAGGFVYSYVPNTTTPKTTWLDPNQTTPNPNPVVLNAGGYAPSGSGGNGGIFGQGNYRQIVKDANGNLVWDGFTSAYGSSAPAGATGTDTAPVGAILPWAGFSIPTNWALAYGQALSRTTYAQLLTAITISTTAGNCVSTSTTLTGFADTSQIRVGAPIESPCLPTGDTVASVVNSTTITVAVAATATGAFTVTVFPWGNGDGVSTFNLPDLRGRVLPGADAMGGTAANRLTASFYGSSASAPGVSGGGQSSTASSSFTITQANLPNVNFPVSGITLSNGTSATIVEACNSSAGTCSSLPGPPFTPLVGASANGGANIYVASNVSVATQGAAASGGSGTALTPTSNAFSVVMPSVTMDWIIKIAPNTTGAGGVTSLGGMFGDIVCASSFVCAPTGSPSVNTIGCAKATVSQLGCVIPDGSTVLITSGGVISAVAGVASTINVGGTAIGSGVNGDILYDNAGTLGVLGVTGSGNAVLATSPSLVTPNLGTPSAVNLTNAQGLPLATAGAVTGTLQPANGGLGTNASAATGVVQFAAGVPSISTALANGTTGTTQTVGDTSTKLATDAFVAGVTTLSSLAISGAQVTSGTVSNARLPLATGTSTGIVQPDGTTLTVNPSGVMTAIGAAATSIDAGGLTSITNPGTTGNLLYNNAGKVGSETVASITDAAGIGTSSGLITQLGGWRASNVQADNDVTNPSTVMRLNKSDYIMLYNPSTHALKMVLAPTTNLSCAINTTGAGGRDQSAAFTGGQIIWLYYIDNGTGTQSCIWSATAPSSGGPSFTLASGYTSWTPAFPVPLVSTATLQPLLPQGGSTTIRVRNNKVWYINPPALTLAGGGGTFVSTIDLSAWVPRPGALSAIAELDPEMVCATTVPCQYGALYMVTSGTPFLNLSMYAPVAGQTVASNPTVELPIEDDGHIFQEWSHINGTATGFVVVTFVLGYSFTNGTP